MRRIRFSSEVWKGAAVGVTTLVTFLVAYASLAFSFGRANGADWAEHAQTFSFSGRLLLGGLLPSALVGGLLGALAGHLRKARTALLAGAAYLGSFVVLAASFTLLALPSEPLEGAWVGLLLGVILTPLLAPLAIFAAVIIERWTRSDLSAGRSGATC
ncbi:hypothetical protein [Polyangium aurulentum]|uniref:hypothetical protein n=1 Tax=Polyangium aurulentum TaxID=2567896 RepID=UPI0010AEE2D3|nr:hypothetical protein [Polyangium aurulentum]UQA59836.1 hypothetical protein E8A73_004875 [Polyangium aurulentum]